MVPDSNNRERTGIRSGVTLRLKEWSEMRGILVDDVGWPSDTIMAQIMESGSSASTATKGNGPVPGLAHKRRGKIDQIQRCAQVEALYRTSPADVRTIIECEYLFGYGRGRTCAALNVTESKYREMRSEAIGWFRAKLFDNTN